MLGSRVARESIHVMCVRGDRRSAEIDSFTYNCSMQTLVNRSSTQNQRSVICSVPFSLFADPLFSLQSRSSAQGKK